MPIIYHKSFKKAYQRQTPTIQEKFKEKLEIFAEDQFDYSLNNHALTGEFRGLRSINITGDIRVHYEETANAIILVNIGSHAQLYK